MTKKDSVKKLYRQLAEDLYSMTDYQWDLVRFSMCKEIYKEFNGKISMTYISKILKNERKLSK